MIRGLKAVMFWISFALLIPIVAPIFAFVVFGLIMEPKRKIRPRDGN